MSEVPNPDSKTLQNCEQHALTMVDAGTLSIKSPELDGEYSLLFSMQSSCLITEC